MSKPPQTVSPPSAGLDEAAIERWRQNIRRSTFHNYQVEMGAALTGRGEFDAALRMYESALGLEPASAEARFALAVIPALTGGEPGGLDADVATRGLARLLARLSRPEDQPVIDHLLEACAAVAGARPVRLALARWQCLAGQMEAAKATLAALAPPPAGIPELRAADAGAAARLAQAALALGERNLTADMLLASMEMADAGDPPPPDDAALSQLYTQLGVRLFQRQGYADAVVCQRWAATLNPDNEGALSGWARALMMVDRVAEGLAVIEPAAERHPHDAWCQYALGLLSLKGREPSVAIARLERAMVVAQEQQSPLLVAFSASHLGLARQAAGDLDGAAAAHEAAIEARPNLGFTYANRALLRLARGDRAAAKRDVEDGLALGREPMALTAAALLALEGGEEKAATDLLREAWQNNPALTWMQPPARPWARDRLYALLARLGFSRPETRPKPSLL